MKYIKKSDLARCYEYMALDKMIELFEENPEQVSYALTQSGNAEDVRIFQMICAKAFGEKYFIKPSNRKDDDDVF